MRWKVRIPGHGHASPIVWGDRIYLQTAMKTDQQAEAKPQEEQQDNAAQMGRRMRGWMGASNNPSNVYEFSLLALDRATGKTVVAAQAAGLRCRMKARTRPGAWPPIHPSPTANT